MAFNTSGAATGALTGGTTGAAFGPWGAAIGAVGGGILGGFFGGGGGSDEEHQRVSTLSPRQQRLQDQRIRAMEGRGAGGAFGEAADYYRNNLSDNPADMAAFSAPALRQYNEEIVPGISEQFAGMGAGGLTSSGFRNAQISGATDLSERLGAIRANLRHSSAQGLANMGNESLGNYTQDVMTQQSTPSFMESMAPIAGQAAASYFGNRSNQASPAVGINVGANTSPYQGGGGVSSPTGGSTMPNFKFSNRGY